MGGIFISYRSGSHAVSVGALADRLRHHFGPDLVFADTQLEPGTPYPDELRRQLRDSDVLLAVIHEGWLESFDEPRDKDWVLFELETAMEMRKPVVPVLLEKVDPPRRDQLPESIGAVAHLQAARVGGQEFRANVDFLVRLLEQHVEPDHRPWHECLTAPKRKRVGRRIIAWAAGLTLVIPILSFSSPSSLWEWFIVSAFVSALCLAVMSLLWMMVLPLVERLTRRWEDEAGTITLREAVKRRWILPVLAMLPMVYLLTKRGPSGGAWREWEVWCGVGVVLLLLHFTHRMWRRYDAYDYQWPPPVSTEPMMFRRAAHRLHEKLTTEPDWRPPRSRAIQREAEAVLRSLGEVRQQLETRASASLPEWIRNCYSGDTAGFLGLAASVMILNVAALAALVASDSGTPGRYLLSTVIMVAAAGFTLGKTTVDRYRDRWVVRRWITELTEWRTTLEPLIFDQQIR